MKRINEAQLRLIVKEELTKLLKENQSMSILPSDVSPELFAKAFKMYYAQDVKEKYTYRYDARIDRTEWLNRLTRANDYTGKSVLTQEEAEEALNLTEMCIKGETYDFGYHEIMNAIRNLFKRSADDAIRKLHDTYFNRNMNLGVITHIIYSPSSYMTQLNIKELKDSFTAEDLEKQINVLTSLKSFTEPKKLSRSTLNQLKSMINDPIGLVQAAELYGML